MHHWASVRCECGCAIGPQFAVNVGIPLSHIFSAVSVGVPLSHILSDVSVGVPLIHSFL